jgi:hypothetical protein
VITVGPPSPLDRNGNDSDGVERGNGSGGRHMDDHDDSVSSAEGDPAAIHVKSLVIPKQRLNS